MIKIDSNKFLNDGLNMKINEKTIKDLIKDELMEKFYNIIIPKNSRLSKLLSKFFESKNCNDKIVSLEYNLSLDDLYKFLEYLIKIQNQKDYYDNDNKYNLLIDILYTLNIEVV